MQAQTIVELLEQRGESPQADALVIRFWEHGCWIEWSWREYWVCPALYWYDSL
jgi:hypothetical protein